MKFKDLSKEEKLALCEALIYGNRVQSYSHLDECWYDKEIDDLDFYSDTEYRIAPEKPSINWDHVAPEYKFLVNMRNGASVLHKAKPVFEFGDWCVTFGMTNAKDFASFKPGNCAPEDSLVERPE